MYFLHKIAKKKYRLPEMREAKNTKFSQNRKI